MYQVTELSMESNNQRNPNRHRQHHPPCHPSAPPPTRREPEPERDRYRYRFPVRGPPMHNGYPLGNPQPFFEMGRHVRLPHLTHPPPVWGRNFVTRQPDYGFRNPTPWCVQCRETRTHCFCADFPTGNDVAGAGVLPEPEPGHLGSAENLRWHERMLQPNDSPEYGQSVAGSTNGVRREEGGRPVMTGVENVRGHLLDIRTHSADDVTQLDYESWASGARRRALSSVASKYQNGAVDYATSSSDTSDVTQTWTHPSSDTPCPKGDALHLPPPSVARAHVSAYSFPHPERYSVSSPSDRLSYNSWLVYKRRGQKRTLFEIKLNFWREISRKVSKWIPTAKIQIFGSSVNGFGMDSSDLDLCLFVPGKQSSTGAQQYLEKLTKIVEGMKLTSNVHIIRAIVPILKFDVNDMFRVDINVNNLVGICNTDLLYCYSNIDERSRMLVVVIKAWAQYNNINSPKDKSLSSYSLVLLCVHYLQSAVTPAILPSLQKEFPDRFAEYCQDKIYESKFPKFDVVPKCMNTQSFADLLLGFFEYYSKFPFEQNVISVRLGRAIPITSYKRSSICEPANWNNNIFIEEPFTLSNAARAVHDTIIFQGIKRLIEQSFISLRSTMELSAVMPVHRRWLH